tara:strand:+ start:4430 stop:4660 length:231 start_codon:yes stop_codon:yes gene_type:complete
VKKKPTYQELKVIRDELKRPQQKRVIEKSKVNPFKFVGMLISIPIGVALMIPVTIIGCLIIFSMWMIDNIKQMIRS